MQLTFARHNFVNKIVRFIIENSNLLIVSD